MVAVAKEWKVRPSELIGDLDTYTAFCFDEACTQIYQLVTAKDKNNNPKYKLYWDEEIEDIKKKRVDYTDTMINMFKSISNNNGQ